MPDRSSLGGFMNTESFGIQATDSVSEKAMFDFLSSDTDTENVEVDEQEKPKETAPVKKVAPKQSTTTTEETTAPKAGLDLETALFGEEGDEENAEETEEGDETSETEESETTLDPIKAYVEDMINLGIFKKGADETEIVVNTQEELAARFEYESRKKAIDSLEGFLDKRGEKYRDMFDAVIGNGVDPKEYLERFVKIEDLSKITSESLKSEETQEGLVRALFKREGRSQKSIDERILKIKNYGELEAEATEALEILKVKESEDLRTLTDNKAREEQIKTEERTKYVRSINEVLVNKLKEKEFDGIPLDEPSARQAFDMLTREAYRSPTGETVTVFESEIAALNKPENRATQVKVALLLQMLKTDPTLSKIQSRAVSKETNTVFKGLQSKAAKTSGAQKTESKAVAPKPFF